MILRWEIILNYLRAPSGITKFLASERRRQESSWESQKSRCDDGSRARGLAAREGLNPAALLLALSMKEGAISNGTRVPLKRKRPGNGLQKECRPVPVNTSVLAQ